MFTATKKQIKHTCITSIIFFVILSFLLELFHLVPAYARPKYLLTVAPWKERIDSLIFFGILFCLCFFIIIIFQYRIWQTGYVYIRDRIKHGLQNLRKHPTYWFINLALIFLALLLSYVLEYAYGHWYIGKKNSLGTYFSSYRFWFFFAILILIFAFFRFHEVFLNKPEKTFVIVALAGTLLLASSMQPTAVISWDDETHYTNSLNISHPTTIKKTLADESIWKHDYPFSFDMKENQEMIQALNQENQQKTISEATQYRKILISPSYLTSGFFLFLGRSLNLPFHICFILGRIGNALTYIILMYFAIKKLKSGKLILMCFALLPTCIFLASNYNYDSWILGFTALGFSYLFSNLQTPEEPATIKDIVIMLLSFLLGFIPKAVYFPLLLLIFFMPKGKFKNPKHYRYFKLATSLCIIFLICSIILPMLMQGPPTDTRGGTDVNGMSQISYIFSNPLLYTRTLLTFLKDYISIEHTDAITQFWAYYGRTPHGVLSILMLVFLTFTDRNEYDVHTTKRGFRITTIFICFATLCLVATALYIAFTVVGADTIEGCQPRYILPVLLPFLYVIGSSGKKDYFNKAFHYYAFYAAAGFVLFDSIWQMVIVKYH